MARKPKHSKNLKSLVAAAILGLGTFILFENLAEASARLSNLFGISREAAGMLGVLVAVGLSSVARFAGLPLRSPGIFTRAHVDTGGFLATLPRFHWNGLVAQRFQGQSRRASKKQSLSPEKIIFILSISCRLIRRVSRAQVQLVEGVQQTGSRS